MNQRNMPALRNASSATLPEPSEWQTIVAMGEALYRSGLLPQHIKTPQAAVAVIQKGRELGIAPMYALSNIVVINGKPTANAELMAAVVYRDQGDDAIRYEETTAERCTISYTRRGWPARKVFSFTLEDARKAGLMTNATWQKYPGAMLRARCISAVARLAFPDSIGGLYTGEELGGAVTVTDDGAVEYLPPAAPVLRVEPARDYDAEERAAIYEEEPIPPADRVTGEILTSDEAESGPTDASEMNDVCACGASLLPARMKWCAEHNNGVPLCAACQQAAAKDGPPAKDMFGEKLGEIKAQATGKPSAATMRGNGGTV